MTKQTKTAPRKPLIGTLNKLFGGTPDTTTQLGALGPVPAAQAAIDKRIAASPAKIAAKGTKVVGNGGRKTKITQAAEASKAKRRAAKVAKAQATKAKKKPATKGEARPGSKLAKIVAMLGRKDGATLAEMAKAVGWKPQAVRGCLWNNVKGRLGLKVELVEGEGDKPTRFLVKGGR